LNLVPITALDEEERARAESNAHAVHDRYARAGVHEQPLIRGPVPVVRPTFALPGASVMLAACERRLPMATVNPCPKRSA
jgi:hypothetical protein